MVDDSNNWIIVPVLFSHFAFSFLTNQESVPDKFVPAFITEKIPWVKKNKQVEEPNEGGKAES